MIIGSRQRLAAQCDHVEMRIDDQIIKGVDHTKSLGLTIDAQLSWGEHVEEICKKVSLAIYSRSKTCAVLYIQRNCNSNL